MRCLYYSYCSEPKYLCCNFCSDKNCEERCKDDHTSCKLYQEGPIEVIRDKPNHIKDKVKNRDKIIFKDKKDINFVSNLKQNKNVEKKRRGRPKKEVAENNNAPFINNEEIK